MSADAPDRGTVVAAIMPDVLGVRLDTDDDAVGAARLVCSTGGRVAGILVAKEIFGRVGVRTRPLVKEGEVVGPGHAVAAVGGPLAAIRGVAPLALSWRGRLSAVASGATPPSPDDPLDAWAARLSPTEAVGHDGPSFRVEFEG